MPRLSRACPARLEKAFVLALFAACGLVSSLEVVAQARQTTAQVQVLIDAGQPGLALEMLSKIVRGKPTPEQQMLRGTARLMLGEIKAGADDLEQSLARDPSLREGWVNLGGLEIAEGNYGAAEKAFRQAYKLAPNRSDSHLNLGAALMMKGEREEAQKLLQSYLALEGGSAEAYFLVATNYALGKVEHLAIESLKEAIRLDERMRLRARRDDRFLGLSSLEYRVLLNTDEYRPPEGSHQAQAAFRKRYDQADGELLYAVLESLRALGLEYDPEVEAAARWAIVWGDFRIKLRNQENGTGVVSLSAPRERYTPDEFRRLSERLFSEIHAAVGG